MKPWLATLAAAITLISNPLWAADQRDYHYTDGHLHYVNFFQESEGTIIRKLAQPKTIA